MSESPATSTYPIRLQPLQVSRVVGVFGSLVIFGIGILVAVVGPMLSHLSLVTWVCVAVGTPIATYGLILAFRYHGLAAIISEQDVLVRGIFGSRRIRRDQIVSITGYPMIKWVDDAGRSRTTPVNALNVARDRALPVFIEHADQGIATLTNWSAGWANH